MELKLSIFPLCSEGKRLCFHPVGNKTAARAKIQLIPGVYRYGPGADQAGRYGLACSTRSLAFLLLSTICWTLGINRAQARLEKARLGSVFWQARLGSARFFKARIFLELARFFRASSVFSG